MGMFDHLKLPPLPEDRSFAGLFEWKVGSEAQPLVVACCALLGCCPRMARLVGGGLAAHALP